MGHSLAWVRAGRELTLAAGLHSWYQQIMSKSIRGTKKNRGRPKTTGAGVQTGMRWQEEELAQIDRWRRAHADLPSRTQAIRLLVKKGLGTK
jgi:hypothetical protein